MDYKKYRVEAQRTFAKVSYLQADSFKELDELHCVIGIVTEIDELKLAQKLKDTVNVIEEIGDAYWYIANLERIRGIKLEYLQTRIGTQSIHNLNTQAVELLDLYKKKVFYKSTKHEDAIDKKIQDVKSFLHDVCNAYAIDPSECMSININKLKVRYPEKFTTENALNRDLDSERKELEG